MEIKTEEFDRLKAQAERHRILAKANNIAAAVWVAHEGLWVSEEFTELTGWTAEQLPNCEEPATRADVRDVIDDWLQNVHSGDRAAARDSATDYFILRKSQSHSDRYRLLCGDGKYLLVDVAGVAVWEKAKIISLDFTVRAVKELQVKVEKAAATADQAEATAQHNERSLEQLHFWAKRVIPAIGAVAAAIVSAVTVLFLGVRESVQKIAAQQEKIEEVVEDSSNLRITTDNYESPLFNARAPEIAILLRSKSQFADLIFIGAYYPSDIPQKSAVYAQYRKSPTTGWLTTEPVDIRPSYDRAAFHFSPEGSKEVYEQLSSDRAFIEYSIAGRLPVEGWQPFFVGVRLPAAASDASKQAAKSEVIRLRTEMSTLLNREV